MPDDPCNLPRPDRNWALFLDLDGTLIDIAPTPDGVTVPAELPALLARLLLAFEGAVAIVSGRTLDDIDRLVWPLTLAAAAQHGAEIRLPGAATEQYGPAEKMVGLLPRIEAFATARSGLLVESKGMTIAVHCRAAPHHQEALEDFMAGIADENAAWLELIAGRCVSELRPRGLDKGSAIRRFMLNAPFAGRIPVFIGDDRTDEDGFAVVVEQGGEAILVGPEAPSAATARIANPAQLLAWLAEVADRLAQGPV